ncbi:hypothetical protein ACQ4PT_013255 [Festuca glaucescens]
MCLRLCKSWWPAVCRSHQANTWYLSKTVPLGLSPRCLSPSPSSTSDGCLPAVPTSLLSCSPPWRTGASSCFLDGVMNVAREFFKLPIEERQKCSNVVNGEVSMQGYGNNMVIVEDQVLDWCDNFNLLVEPESERIYSLWPTQPTSFRNILCEYTVRCRAMANLILQNLAKLLNLNEEYFVNMLGDTSLTQAGFNYYPQCAKPDHVVGLRPHTDGTVLTLNFIDCEVSGLQVQKNGVWYNVPIIPNALIVNTGDVMEIMSNGFFKSMVHRVVTNVEKERLSLVMFYTLDPEKEIEPLSELVDDMRPGRYTRIKTKDYIAKFYDTFARGEWAIDTLKIQG